MTFISVYSKTTGRKQDVPEHWLDHPVLGRDFRKTPLSQQQQRAVDAATATADHHETPATGGQE